MPSAPQLPDATRSGRPAAAPVLIRAARPADVPQLHRLIVELATFEQAKDEVAATPEDLRRALFAEQPAVFAAVADVGGSSSDAGGSGSGSDGVVGMAMWFVTYSTWVGRHGIWLEDLYVTPQHRGRGLGQALLAHLAATAVERGYGRLEWWVLDWNAPAIAFYRRLGATPMQEWTVHRVDGAALADLAALAEPAAHPGPQADGRGRP